MLQSGTIFLILMVRKFWYFTVCGMPYTQQVIDVVFFFDKIVSVWLGSFSFVGYKFVRYLPKINLTQWNYCILWNTRRDKKKVSEFELILNKVEIILEQR